MALIDDVKVLCDRLATRGWRKLILDVSDNGLDIVQSSKAKLRSALTKPLTNISDSSTGFEDLNKFADKGIEAGSVSKSLLYHALASPLVHPTADGSPSSNGNDYPSLEELETLENFIYSLVSDRSDLDDTFVAVFAYQYRVASRTSHLRHADFAYSRTGVARVGTAKANYDRSRRSFWVLPKNGVDDLCVLPARYGSFLARRSKPGAAGTVQGGHSGSANDDFIFPVHKLFDGKECLDGNTLSLDYSEFHRNEKLRKIHSLEVSQGGMPLPAGFDISKTPYVRDSTNAGKLASLKSIGSTVLVSPTPGTTLVRTVSQRNSVANRKQIVHFVVPPVRSIRQRRTRFESSLEIPALPSLIPGEFGDRLAPEYVNIRQKVDPAGSVNQQPEDLNQLNESDFQNALENGGFAAAHFTDDSCDGCVTSAVTGLQVGTNANLPAFSLITAPDFFPLADQIEVESDPTIQRVEPLSKGRLPVNPTLPRADELNVRAFNRDDRTVTAIVGDVALGDPVSVVGQPNRSVSQLPDSASNVFAPGWDTSKTRDTISTFLTSSGLGSPFPEDAKLCAALASFWPSVAPDNGRTFGNKRFGNQLPMLDEELGFHPKHERVQSGDVTSFRGWDGEFGPFYETVGGKRHVNFVSIERSDYVVHALAGRITVALTAEIQSEELIRRHQAFVACQSVADLSPRNNCLVVFRKIDDWSSSGGIPQLVGGGYLIEFADFRGTPKKASEKERLRQEVATRHICQLAENGIGYKRGSAAFIFDRH